MTINAQEGYPRTYRITEVTKVSDGDTFWCHLTWHDDDALENWAADYSSKKPRRIRLVQVNTPERGAPNYAKAKGQLAEWLAVHSGRLTAVAYGEDDWQRKVSNVYVDDDPKNSASAFMLSLGYPPFIGKNALGES